jgi:hypothetical protein
MKNALQAERNRAARLRGVRQAVRNAMKASREAPVTNLARPIHRIEVDGAV